MVPQEKIGQGNSADSVKLESKHLLLFLLQQYYVGITVNDEIDIEEDITTKSRYYFELQLLLFPCYYVASKKTYSSFFELM